MTAEKMMSAPKRRTRAEVQQLVAEFVSSGSAITSPRFSLGLPISRSGAFQTLLPLCGLPSKHRLKRPGHWHDGILATTTRSRSLGHYFLLADHTSRIVASACNVLHRL